MISNFNTEHKGQYDEDAFRELYNRCAIYCMKGLSKYTKNMQEAEDVFASAISVYWLREKQGKIKSNQNIPAYVFTIARNMLFSNRKKQIYTEDISSIHFKDMIDDSEWKGFFEKTTLTDKLKSALNEMSASCRQLLIFKYVYNYTYEEMAIKTNRKSADSLKTQTFRCLKKLRERMKK